jgi:hypothetical protein
VTANPFVKLRGDWCGVYIQLRAEGFDTGLILSQCEMVLSLATVTLHQEAVGVFAAVISAQYLLTRRNAGGILLTIKIDLTEAVKGFQVGQPQSLAS